MEEKNNPIASGTGRGGSGHVDFPHGRWADRWRTGVGTREVGQPDVQLPAESVFAQFRPLDQPAEPFVQPAQSSPKSIIQPAESII